MKWKSALQAIWKLIENTVVPCQPQGLCSSKVSQLGNHMSNTIIYHKNEISFICISHLPLHIFELLLYWSSLTVVVHWLLVSLGIHGESSVLFSFSRIFTIFVRSKNVIKLFIWMSAGTMQYTHWTEAEERGRTTWTLLGSKMAWARTRH